MLSTLYNHTLFYMFTLTYWLPSSLNNNDKLIHNYMIVTIILINYNKIRNVLIE